MEKFQEKSALARENPVYDAIPLIIIHKGEKKKYNEKFAIEREDLKYYVSSPFWMRCRLLLFWILWATLVMALIICILAYFRLIPRMCCSSNAREIWHSHEQEHEQRIKNL